MEKIIDNLENIQQYQKILLMYSGGLDSSYILTWAKQHNIKVVALRGMGRNEQIPKRLQAFLKKQGVELITIDYTDELVRSYISKGILATGFYQGLFPISSSYTRPLIAKHAAKTAIEFDCECIVHTSNFHQNSAARFNNAVRHFAPDIPVAIPYIKSTVTREEKMKTLLNEGYEIEGGIYSIDENIWSRVIENHDLDYLDNEVGDNHFQWTLSGEVPTNKILTITFKEGLPVAIEGNEMSLTETIEKLNEIGSRYKIGRFNGVEDTPTGPKNHEVREAPAAEIIHKAKGILESSVLTQDELRLKKSLDYRWSEMVVSGQWFSLEKDSLDLAITKLNEPVSGSVQVRIQPYSVFPAAVASPNSLDFHSLHDCISEAKANFSYSEFYHLQNIHQTIRNNK